MKPDTKNYRDETRFALTALRAAELVIVPTDTVYGLVADANNAKAMQRLYTLKQRPSEQPFSLLVSDQNMAERYGIFDARAHALAKQFWPGALTLIVPKHDTAAVCPNVIGAHENIGLRIPDHEGTRGLIAQFGGALAAPSANRAGQPAPTASKDISSVILAGVALCIENVSCTNGASSTLVELGNDKVRILREGDIKRSEILDVLTPFPNTKNPA